VKTRCENLRKAPRADLADKLGIRVCNEPDVPKPAFSVGALRRRDSHSLEMETSCFLYVKKETSSGAPERTVHRPPQKPAVGFVRLKTAEHHASAPNTRPASSTTPTGSPGQNTTRAPPTASRTGPADTTRAAMNPGPRNTGTGPGTARPNTPPGTTGSRVGNTGQKPKGAATSAPVAAAPATGFSRSLGGSPAGTKRARPTGSKAP
jgi:hypothetical protein